MEQATQETFSERVLHQREVLGGHVSESVLKMRETLATRDIVAFYPFQNASECAALFSTLGISQVTQEQTIAYRYQSSYSDHYDRYENNMQFDGLRDLNTLLGSIGDAGMGSDFPNNFKIALALNIDSETTAVVTEEVDEQPNICDGCVDDEVYASGEYSCDHESDDITISRVIYVLDSAQIDQSMEEILTSLL